MPSQTISISLQSSDKSVGQSTTVTDAVGKAVDETLAPSTTNTEVDVVLKAAHTKSVFLQSVGGDLTIKTNSTGSPGDTVVLTAGQVLFWSSTAVIGTNPFPSADVTKLYLSSTAGTVFNLRAIVDATNG